MPGTCKRRNCNDDKYSDYEHCILHCDKSNFSGNDITEFWQKIRAEYVEYLNQCINNEINIVNVEFPDFEAYSRNRNNFFAQDYHFRLNIIFSKCTFKKTHGI